MMTIAKGITNATVPMGAVCVRNGDLRHGRQRRGRRASSCFTATPIPAIRSPRPPGLATLELYRAEGLFERAASLESYWADAVHSLRGLPHVIDLRNIGIVAGIELEPRAGAAGRARLRDVPQVLRGGRA